MQPIGYYSLFEIDKPVWQRIVVLEVRGQSELLVELNHCPVGDNTCTRPQSLHQCLHNILKSARDILPANALLFQEIVDPFADGTTHSLKDTVEPVVDSQLKPRHQGRTHRSPRHVTKRVLKRLNTSSVSNLRAGR